MKAFQLSAGNRSDRRRLQGLGAASVAAVLIGLLGAYLLHQQAAYGGPEAQYCDYMFNQTPPLGVPAIRWGAFGSGGFFICLDCGGYPECSDGYGIAAVNHAYNCNLPAGSMTGYGASCTLCAPPED